MGSWVLFVIGSVAIVFVIQGRVTSLSQSRRNMFSEITPLLEERYDLVDRLEKKRGELSLEDPGMFASLVTLKIAARDAYGTGAEKFAAELDLDHATKEMLGFLADKEGWEQEFQDFLELNRNIEEKIIAFNGITSEYNAALKQFPASFLARFTKAAEEPLFETRKNRKIKRIS